MESEKHISSFLILYFPLSLILGSLGAWVVSHWGIFLNLMDRPSERSSHDEVVPKGGGIGVLAAFLFCSIVLRFPKAFWIPAALLAICSFWGDRSEISPGIRLIIQLTASIVFLGGIFAGKEMSMGTYVLIVPLTLFAVGTANYYNFMDGINGIAGITGIVGFGLLAFFCFLLGLNLSYMILAVCMSLSCLGFLPFNMPRARVFMGDVGSILLGIVFAGLVVLLSQSLLDFVCLASFLFPFYADELTTMATRVKARENLLRPHRRHIYQLLANEKGIAHWKVSVGYGLVQAFVGLSALALRNYGLVPLLVALGAYFVAFIVAGNYIRGSVMQKTKS